MFDFEELVAIAYKKERASSRRLARGARISAHDALVRTLEKAAGEGSLSELVHARRSQRSREQEVAKAREAARASAHAGRPCAETPAGVWLAWFDGSATPNPGRIGIGGLLRNPEGETVTISAAAGHGDSSVAEYLALISILEAARAARPVQLIVYGDSRVVIDDVRLESGEGARALAHYAERARRLIGEIGDVRLHWIPRGRNAGADALSREALAVGPGSRAAQASSRTSATLA
jgi:ribonuclease HI